MPSPHRDRGAARAMPTWPQLPQLNYEEVRERMQDGDVVLFDGQQMLSSLVKRLTRGSYSHCGIVLTWGGRRMLAHADVANGVQTTLLSTVLNRSPGTRPLWLALSAAARRHLDMDTLRAEAQSHLGLPYDVWGVVHAGAHVFFGTRAPRTHVEPRPTHCSAFVARCFRVAGQPLFDLMDALASPDDVARSLAFEPQGTLSVPYPSVPTPVKPMSLTTRIKLMSLEVIEKASALLPEALRRAVSSAMESETLVREGQAALATTDTDGRYGRMLQEAVDEVVSARLEALRAVDAFRRGDLSLTHALERVQAWNEAGTKVLWQRLDDEKR